MSADRAGNRLGPAMTTSLSVHALLVLLVGLCPRFSTSALEVSSNEVEVELVDAPYAPAITPDPVAAQPALDPARGSAGGSSRSTSRARPHPTRHREPPTSTAPLSPAVAREDAPAAPSVQSPTPALAAGTPNPVPDADTRSGDSGGCCGGGGGGSGAAMGSGDGHSGGGAGERGSPATVPTPPTRPCVDPIAGVWQALMRFRSRDLWSQITLSIERDRDELRGWISNHEWLGGDEVRHPLSCAEGTRQRTVRMAATGTIDGDRFSFAGHGYQVLPGGCAPLGMYNPDRFHGTLVTADDMLYALWDDGGIMQRQPIHFRRTACSDPLPQPSSR